MVSVNYCCIAGNLTRDPELRYTPQGVAVADFTVAVGRKWTDKASGEKKEKTAFIACTAWKKTAELAGEYLKKGSPVLVEGELDQENWDDSETGKKRSKTKVTVNKVHFLERKAKQGEEEIPTVVPDTDGGGM